ncbi:hypothetical protein BU25DRAFT_187946 [Macroventuria anomochaeta]|uniref:Uncharacterized protein n=1 Tax=Macroventuria anomochaeta TaxID=301207 RepID=A0ACB6SBF5_9PLEO|nr:uncharacterized protein BU25DRAFT_187946 [Macroventuria anomochaeta]KAF2631466.1 hypothetical protein BU25DRAFT_187946 [Macroventuria anomochaeta]
MLLPRATCCFTTLPCFSSSRCQDRFGLSVNPTRTDCSCHRQSRFRNPGQHRDSSMQLTVSCHGACVRTLGRLVGIPRSICR